MNRLRCFLFAAILVISSATFALGGEIQGPGKSDPSQTPSPTAFTTTSNNVRLTQSTPTEIQVTWPDATAMLVELPLLTLF